MWNTDILLVISLILNRSSRQEDFLSVIFYLQLDWKNGFLVSHNAKYDEGFYSSNRVVNNGFTHKLYSFDIKGVARSTHRQILCRYIRVKTLSHIHNMLQFTHSSFCSILLFLKLELLLPIQLFFIKMTFTKELASARAAAPPAWMAFIILVWI